MSNAYIYVDIHKKTLIRHLFLHFLNLNTGHRHQFNSESSLILFTMLMESSFETSRSCADV